MLTHTSYPLLLALLLQIIVHNLTPPVDHQAARMFVVHLMKHSSHIALVLVDSSIEEDWPTVLGDATPVGRIIEREQPFVELSRWKPWDVVRVGLDARQDVLRRTRIPSI